MIKYELAGFNLRGECNWRKIEKCKDCWHLKTKYKFLFFKKHFVCDYLTVIDTGEKEIISNPYGEIHVHCPLYDLEKARKMELGLRKLADDGEFVG